MDGAGEASSSLQAGGQGGCASGEAPTSVGLGLVQGARGDSVRFKQVWARFSLLQRLLDWWAGVRVGHGGAEAAVSKGGRCCCPCGGEAGVPAGKGLAGCW